jgi:hypothetical protein
MSGETQLKPFFFADEANFTATCIRPLNRFPTSSRPRGSGCSAARRTSTYTSWRLRPPLRLDATRGSRMLQTNLAGGTACENLCPMPREAGARYPRTQSMERPLVVARLLLLGSVRRSLRAGAIRSENFVVSASSTLTLWTRRLCHAASCMSS